MKIEFLAHWQGAARHRRASRADRVPAALRAAASRSRRWLQLRNALGAAALGERLARHSRSGAAARGGATASATTVAQPGTADGSRALRRHVHRATSSPRTRARRGAVLEAARLLACIEDTPRGPLCCGRTFLSAGHGRRGEARSSRAWSTRSGPQPQRGVPIVGLEPSCLFSLRDELPACCSRRTRSAALARNAFLFEEFLAREARAARSRFAAQTGSARRCCTATATRRRSARCPRSSRC